MKSGQHLKLPKSEMRQLEDDLRRQARMERLKIDIKVKDNGDDTVDIAWTVSEGTAPATSTTRAGGVGEREGVTSAAPTARSAPTAATSGPEPPPSAASREASAGLAPLRPRSSMDNLSSSISEAEQRSQPWFDLTSTVKSAVDQFLLAGPVSAAALANEILKNHSDYVDGKAISRPLAVTEVKFPAEKWVEKVRSLFDPARIQTFSKSNDPPQLHGRLFIIGLGLLDPPTRRQLEKDGIFKGLQDELREKPLFEILTEGGRLLLEPPDSVPNQPDDPLRMLVQDQLGRAAFARYLAERIAAVPAEAGAYSIHVYGPWGSGKSTLLNFLREIMCVQKDWLGAEFNAWRNQHLPMPWWSLMETVFEQTKDKMKFWDRFQERLWRFNTGRLVPFISLLVIASWAIAFLVLPSLAASHQSFPGLASLAKSVEDITKLLTVVGTISGIVVAYNRSLLFGSSKAAEAFLESTRNPMDEIRNRFTALTKRLPKRLIVFIDDLDRCQTSYVISLLEGMQTLFREAPVVFVVAADRKWLNACYEENYQKFKPSVHQPGKPLGALFLEKVFQFSTSVPGVPKELRTNYWDSLISVKSEDLHKELADARRNAKEVIETNQSEGAIIRAVQDSATKGFAEQQAIREEAAIRLAAPEVFDRTEHGLKQYSGVLEPNPRAMKRLVNAYSVNRALAILSRVDIEREQLAIWTILSLRWPALAEYLEGNPELVNSIGHDNLPSITEELSTLFKDSDVANLLKGGTNQMLLDANIVRQWALLRGC